MLFDDSSQCPGSLLATQPFLTLFGACLLGFGGVYPVEPDLGIAYVDGIAVNDTGLACDVCHRNGWKREKDQGEDEGKAYHRGMIPGSFRPVSIFPPSRRSAATNPSQWSCVMPMSTVLTSTRPSRLSGWQHRNSRRTKKRQKPQKPEPKKNVPPDAITPELHTPIKKGPAR